MKNIENNAAWRIVAKDGAKSWQAAAWRGRRGSGVAIKRLDDGGSGDGRRANGGVAWRGRGVLAQRIAWRISFLSLSISKQCDL